MQVYESVTDAIGRTPLFRLNHVQAPAPIYVKAEFLSIGGSVKDRAALAMIEQAERDGSLRPGGTIVEATSGNTGIGLAMVGGQRGYRVVIGVSDKAAQEKVDILKAYGAEVVLATTGLPLEHPDHLFNVVRRIVDETPGAWLADQYDNPANPQVHTRTTGPEIWEQTEGRVTHFVAGIGTGGTISGTGRYLKEVSGGRVTIVAADPESSVYSGGDGSPYWVESIGHSLHPETAADRWPDSFRPDVVDRYERIGDRTSLLTARDLGRREGLLVGASSGTAVAAALRVAGELTPDDLVVVLLPDSGRSYLSKGLNDDWLRHWGFLEDSDHRVRMLTDRRTDKLPTVPATATVGDTVAAFADAAQPGAVLVVVPRAERPYGVASAEILGTVSPAGLGVALAAGQIRRDDPVPLGLPLPVVGVGESLPDAVAALGDHDGVVVLEDGRALAVLSRAELLDRHADPVGVS
ncbi:MAG TPA: pyridoxal-phosphate dependent enzyme [Pseudonocardiaceae bacterium]|nr:pyridoxal-phosphate dependent enzyme [Pseudonocardiaceae bacterium]